MALFCSGVFEGRVIGVVGSACSLSMRTGFDCDPILLGILADPSMIDEKLTFMNRSIMSWVACGESNGAICEALKI